jgi:undecaprenyl pyrophosphate phosphatase UppP
MDDLLKNVVVQLGVFAAAVYFFSFILRRVVENIFPCLVHKAADGEDYKSAISRWWNTVILYAIPPAWGVAIAFFIRNTALFPDSFREWQTAIVFGIAFGSMSGLLYKLLKRVLAAKAGVKVKDEDDAVVIMDNPEPAGQLNEDKKP